MQKSTFFLLLLVCLLLVIALAVSLGRRDVMYELLAGLEDLSSCASCLALLVPLKALANIGDDALTEALSKRIPDLYRTGIYTA